MKDYKPLEDITGATRLSGETKDLVAAGFYELSQHIAKSGSWDKWVGSVKKQSPITMALTCGLFFAFIGLLCGKIVIFIIIGIVLGVIATPSINKKDKNE